jgi:hypothetical protein
LLAEVRSGSNSGEQLLSIHASCAESEGTVRYVRIVESGACSVCQSDPRISGNRWISPRLRRGSSSPVRNLHCCTKNLFVFFVFPSVQGLPHTPLTFPRGDAPPPSVSPPRRGPLTSPRRRRLGRAPQPMAPAALGLAVAAGPTSSSPAQPPPLSSMDGRRR